MVLFWSEDVDSREGMSVGRELRFGFYFPCLGIESLGFVHSPTGSLDIEDDGMVHHAIDNRGGDDGVSEVIAEFLEANIRCKNDRTLAVTAVDDLEEQRGIFTVLLLQPVKP